MLDGTVDDLLRHRGPECGGARHLACSVKSLPRPMLPLHSRLEDLLMARDMTGLGIVGVFEPITESSRSLSLFVIDKHLECSTNLTTTSAINLLN